MVNLEPTDPVELLKYRLNVQSVLIEVLCDLVRTDKKITQEQFSEMIRNKAMLMYGDSRYLN